MQGHKIIIAGGGTGGHIFPAIAIARALERLEPGVQLLFVGAKGKMEMEKVPQAGYNIKGLDIAGMNRSQWWKNILLPWKLIKSLKQAKGVIKSFAPDVVAGVGGYASFPILRSAQKANIPTVIQEQNSFAGKSNKLLGKKAAKICVAYQGMEKFFPKDKILNTGNPVRESISHCSINQQTAQLQFDLTPGKKTLFIVGGSLGAKSINDAMIRGLGELLQYDMQIIWQTGKLSYKNVILATKGNEIQVKAFDFIKEMEVAYAAADVVISRAGALAVAELCVAGKAAIFVPYPFAAEDHQTQNALSLVHQDAALLIPDAETDKRLIPEAIHLIENKALQQKLINNIRKLAITNADERIAKEILKLA